MIPKPRGALSERLFECLAGGDDLPAVLGVPAEGPEDAQIALWALYELHYRGFLEVAEELEWDPTLLRLRRTLEQELEARLRDRYPGRERGEDDFAESLFAFIAKHDGPAISPYVQSRADRDQVLDLLRHRSIYHLKEFDPTAWVVPRLPVEPKAALMEVAFDEYGAGDPNRLHAHLFARGLEACGLRSEYGAYVDEVPLEILEQNNAVTMFGLHRRLRGAAMGHFAAFEATSAQPSRRLARGLRRLGLAQEMVDYYDEHVEADAVHEQLACRSICGTLVEAEPQLTDDVFFGAFTCLDLEARFATYLLDQWGALA